MLKVRNNDDKKQGETIKWARNLLGNRIVTTKVKPMLFQGPWEPKLRASHQRSLTTLTLQKDTLYVTKILYSLPFLQPTLLRLLETSRETLASSLESS